jgi:hypothetical protein
MEKLAHRAQHVAQETVIYAISAGVTLVGIFFSSYGFYRLSHSVLESPLFFIGLGLFLVLTFNRDIRVRLILSLPKQVRQYLYEKSLIDLALDVSVSAQSVMAMLASGVLRREEIRRVTDTLPMEYNQLVNQRGLVYLLPQPLQRMLNPLYSVESDFMHVRPFQLLGDVVSIGNNSRLAIADGARAADSLDDDGADDDAIEIPTAAAAAAATTTPATTFTPPVVRGVQVRSGASIDTDNDGGDRDGGGGFFVLPGGGATVAASLVDSNDGNPSTADNNGYNDAARGSNSRRPPAALEDVLYEIGSARLQEAWNSSAVIMQQAASYVLTGGDMSDGQLLGSFLGLGAAGGLVSNYDAAEPIAAASATSVGIRRDDVRVRVGTVALRTVMRPLHSGVRSLGPVLYLLSLASGGMLAARMCGRYNVYSLCNRAALQPLYSVVGQGYARAFALYRRMTVHGEYHAHIAAVVTTLAVVVAWRLRQRWRQWQWLIALVVARLKQRIAQHTDAVSSLFQ